MALLWADGFDWINPTSDGTETPQALITKYTGGYSLNTSVVAETGRGGKGVAWNGGTSSGNFITTPAIRNPESGNTCIIGFACRPGSPFINSIAFLRVNQGDNTQVALRYDTSSNTIGLYWGDSSLRESSPSVVGLIDADKWAYLEFKLVIDDSVGNVSMRINGKPFWTSANYDTKRYELLWDNIFIRPRGIASNTHMDDLYICDTLGDTNNDFLGDVIIEAQGPSIDGSYTEFSPSSGLSHVNLVNDYVLQGTPAETTYVDSLVTGERELFQFADLPERIPNPNPKVLGVVVEPLWRITEETPRQTRGVAHLNRQSVEVTSKAGDPLNVGTLRKDYLTHTPLVIESDPNGEPWTSRTVNKSQFGVKIET